MATLFNFEFGEELSIYMLPKCFKDRIQDKTMSPQTKNIVSVTYLANKVTRLQDPSASSDAFCRLTEQKGFQQKHKSDHLC